MVLTVLINIAVRGLESLDKRYNFNELICRALCKRKLKSSLNVGKRRADDKPSIPTVDTEMEGPTSDVQNEIALSTTTDKDRNDVTSIPDVDIPAGENSDSEPEEAEIARQLAETSDLKQLRRMGILSCLAMAMHNVPEGLAAFVATTADPSFGAAIAVATIYITRDS